MIKRLKATTNNVDYMLGTKHDFTSAIWFRGHEADGRNRGEILLGTRQTEYMQNQIDLLESMLEKQEQDASEIVDEPEY